MDARETSQSRDGWDLVPAWRWEERERVIADGALVSG